MSCRIWPALLLAYPGLVGCTPPGPPEFYRSALAARSEFVDSLARVVDEQTAKDKFKVAEKVMNDRLADVKEGLDRSKFDNNFQKLSRDNFQLKNIEPGDKAGMIDGMKAYVNYCKEIKRTNIRLAREINRLHMVHRIEALNKARSQIESNQPFAASPAAALAEFPNIQQMLDSLEKPSNVNLCFVPNTGLTMKNLKDDLKSGLPDEDLEIILSEDPEKHTEKKPGKESELKAPELPPYPEWAKVTDQRTKWRFTEKAAPKR